MTISPGSMSTLPSRSIAPVPPTVITMLSGGTLIPSYLLKNLESSSLSSGIPLTGVYKTDLGSFERTSMAILESSSLGIKFGSGSPADRNISFLPLFLKSDAFFMMSASNDFSIQLLRDDRNLM